MNTYFPPFVHVWREGLKLGIRRKTPRVHFHSRILKRCICAGFMVPIVRPASMVVLCIASAPASASRFRQRVILAQLLFEKRPVDLLHEFDQGDGGRPSTQ